MSRRRSSFDPETETRAIERLGEQIADHFGVPITDVRYANYRFHNGERWTIWIGWERHVDGVWQAESWLPAAPTI
jgi:hypothetical protein